MDERLVAVADGVGGWNRKGVNPGIFARELCGHVSSQFEQERSEGKKIFEISLRELLVQAVKKTKATGTSTFVMATIDEEDSIVKSLNLGDSGIMIVTANSNGSSSSSSSSTNPSAGFDLKFRSKEQQYRFNHPYQCGTNYKLPYHSDSYMHIVKHNDIVVLASDGIFDNLYD